MTLAPFRVRIPGSTSNLGPGFDALAVALGLYLDVQIESIESDVLEWTGEWPQGDRNVFEEAFLKAADRFHIVPGGLRFDALNQIPLQRGLGSSAAAITGGILAASHLAGVELNTEGFLDLAMPLEGHPDNLAAAWQGGWVLCWQEGPTVRIESLPIRSPLLFVVAIPELKVSTARAREALPESYSGQDVIHTIQRSCLLMHALCNDRRDLLTAAFQDRVHQPYRMELIPGASRILKGEGLPQALKPFYRGSFLSGSGSTMCTLTDEPKAAPELAQWMMAQFNAVGLETTLRILSPTTRGATVLTGLRDK